MDVCACEVFSVPPKVFVSHSSTDHPIAEAFVDLIVGTIAIHDDDVRCTSVAGNRLKTGAPVIEAVRDDLHGCQVVVGLISGFSRASAWVLCEVGGALFARKRFFPVMVGMKGSDLPGPLAGYNAVSLQSREDLGNMLEELAEAIESKRRPLNKVNAAIDTFLDRLARILDARPSEEDASNPIKQALHGRSKESKQLVQLLELHLSVMELHRRLEAQNLRVPALRHKQLATIAEIADKEGALNVLMNMFTLDWLRSMCNIHDLPVWGNKDKVAARLLSADLSAWEG